MKSKLSVRTVPWPKLFEQVTRPRIVDGKRVSGLRFDDLDDQRVIGLLQNLCRFLVLPKGFFHSSMRKWMDRRMLGVSLSNDL
uniref:Uncharacterized protein n=1 Tax=Candidatus Kentrum sp. LPFa TaxID=2126335 RepID=A0A450VXT0_9GAMM|nr:MAG: hypothetical protein BECKLPF1236B_GA0070989_101026 [Candidatus Kentron sp. LPFa]